MHRIKDNIKLWLQSFIVEAGTLIMGIYVFFHLNYLDDPQVTPYKPPKAFQEAIGFTDDWWFAAILLIISIFTIFSIVKGKNKWIESGLMFTNSIYMLITVEFTIRAFFEPHFNITWIILIIFEALMLTINYKGGGTR